MEEKVVFTKKEEKINELLKEGWRVKHVAGQCISITSNSYNSERGEMCFVLEREIN